MTIFHFVNKKCHASNSCWESCCKSDNRFGIGSFNRIEKQQFATENGSKCKENINNEHWQLL